MPAQFSVSPGTYNNSDGQSGSTTITVTSSGHGSGEGNSWELDMSTKPSWVTVNPPFAGGTSSVSVSWSYNIDESERVADLLFELIGDPSTYNDNFVLTQAGNPAPTVDPGEYGIVIKNDSSRVVVDGFFENYAVAEEVDVNLDEGLGNLNSGVAVTFVNSYSVPPLIGARLNITGTGDSCTGGCTHGSPYFAGFRGYIKDSGGNYTGFKAAYGETGDKHGVVWTAFVIVPSSVLPNPAEADSFGLEVRTADDKLAFSSSFRYFLFHDQINFPWGTANDGSLGNTHSAWFDDRLHGNPTPDNRWDALDSGWAGVGASAGFATDSWHQSAHLNIDPTFTNVDDLYVPTNIGIDMTPNTFHGSMWAAGYGDKHIQNYDTISHYDTQGNAVFIINNTSSQCNYGWNWAYDKTSMGGRTTRAYVIIYWCQAVLIRRSDTSISLQCVASNFTDDFSHNEFIFHPQIAFNNWTPDVVQANNIQIPYGEVSK